MNITLNLSNTQLELILKLQAELVDEETEMDLTHELGLLLVDSLLAHETIQTEDLALHLK